MTPLVEVHDEAEFGACAGRWRWLVGINARNLKTLEVHRARCSRKVAKGVPSDIILVAESGILRAA